MATEARAWVAHLRLRDFRNHADSALATDGRPVVLTGPNGAGKTNVLEALSFLMPGRGLRGVRLGEVDRRDPGADAPVGGPWGVAARIVTAEGPRDVGTGRDATAGRERRIVRIDGVTMSSQQALCDVVSVVWLTPQMDRLFQDGAAGRRRFLDRLVAAFDPAHGGRLAAYEHALRERGRVLRGEEGRPDPTWRVALEARLAERGVAIAAARRALVTRLATACLEGGGAFPRAGLALTGELEGWLAEVPALEAEERFKAQLAAARLQDSESGGAAIGPHRSDLAVQHLEQGMPAGLCSTGEQKALLISIVLAHARLVGLDRGLPPLLLLDEVAAHLDSLRREALFERLLALGSQAWMTGTDPSLFEALGQQAHFVSVRDSALVALNEARL